MKRKVIPNFLAKGLIILAHLALLGWIIHVLKSGGTMATSILLIHFLGLALYGSSLIFFCAWWAKR